MKKIKFLFILAAATLLMSCTADEADNLTDCVGTRDEINARFDAQILWVQENTNPVNVYQIQLLSEERAKALEKSCD